MQITIPSPMTRKRHPKEARQDSMANRRRQVRRYKHPWTFSSRVIKKDHATALVTCTEVTFHLSVLFFSSLFSMSNISWSLPWTCIQLLPCAHDIRSQAIHFGLWHSFVADSAPYCLKVSILQILCMETCHTHALHKFAVDISVHTHTNNNYN